MILYDHKRRLTADECFTSLTKTFERSALSRATVGNWFREFRMGRHSLEHYPRASCPHTAVTDKNVAAVRNLIIIDLHIVYSETEKTLGIGFTAINTILHEYLQFVKLCAQWVPHSLTEKQKTARVA